MKFKADEIASVIQHEIEQYESELDVREVGTVLEIGDGIARVYGLSGVMAGEMVAFPNGVNGLAFNLEENSVGVIILGDYLGINEGDEVRAWASCCRCPWAKPSIGRVLDPLGNPLDGKGPVHSTERRPVEFLAPGVAERQPVCEPLQTGLKAIDSMTPIGRGTARTDHWRPQDRQDGDRPGHDPEPKRLGREVLLRGHRPEGLVRRRRDQDPGRTRRDGVHDRDRLRRQQPRPACSTSPPIPGRRWPSTSCSTASTR